MITGNSNEGKIARGLSHLGCAAMNFCKFANVVSLSRFQQAMNDIPGKHFNDDDAARLLEVLGELYELQVDADAITGSHLPLNFARVDDVMTALVIRRVARIAGEEGNHTLDKMAERATNAVRNSKDQI